MCSVKVKIASSSLGAERAIHRQKFAVVPSQGLQLCEGGRQRLEGNDPSMREMATCEHSELPFVRANVQNGPDIEVSKTAKSE